MSPSGLQRGATSAEGGDSIGDSIEDLVEGVGLYMGPIGQHQPAVFKEMPPRRTEGDSVGDLGDSKGDL